MDLMLNDPYAYLDTFLLVFVRTLGLMLIVPVFGNRSVPQMLKIIFAFFLTVLTISARSFTDVPSSFEAVNFAVAVAMEFLTGWLIGFAAYLVFSVLSLAGQFIDMQIGFSMVNVFDPMSQIQLTITGNLYYYVLMIVVIVTNAHHFFIVRLMESYEVIPLGGIVLSPDLEKSLIEYMSQYFSIALQIAAPVFFVMLITNVILGILARAVPQLNMFVIGFPVKILLGLSTIYVTLSLFGNISDMLITDSQELMREVIKGMMPVE